MVSSFDLDNTQPGWALCYRFNIVLRGPQRHADGDEIVQGNVQGSSTTHGVTPSQTVGPFFNTV